MSSAGDEAIGLAASAGLVLEPWQELAVRTLLALRSDRKWAALEGALIVPRQNGKDSILEVIELADLFLFRTPLVTHSTHLFKTTAEHFIRVKNLIEGSDDLRRRCFKPRESHGEESITARNGCRLRFIARERGGGRGFTGDRVILNEALILSDRALGNLIPTLSAKSVKGNPQVLYVSSAPFEWGHKDFAKSEVLHRIRKAGRAGDPSLAYVEFASDETSAEADPIAAAYEANPGMGSRISEEFVRMEHSRMDPDEFRRERLGLSAGPPDEYGSVWPVGAWDACSDPALAPDVGLVIGVDVHPDRTSAAVGVGDALGRVELVDAQPGVGWVVERAVGLAVKHNARVAVQSTGPAGALIPDLERAGVRVVPVTQGDVRAACGAFYDAVAGRQRFIRWHDVLNRAAGSAIRKDSGDGWVFDRRAGADVSPLYAVLLARWAATSPGPEPLIFAY